MNDIYEYKARKYKNKYLKLKYIAEGGVFEKIRNKLGYNLGFNSIMTPRDKSKPIDHTQSASSELATIRSCSMPSQGFLAPLPFRSHRTESSLTSPTLEATIFPPSERH